MTFAQQSSLHAHLKRALAAPEHAAVVLQQRVLLQQPPGPCIRQRRTQHGLGRFAVQQPAWCEVVGASVGAFSWGWALDGQGLTASG